MLSSGRVSEAEEKLRALCSADDHDVDSRMLLAGLLYTRGYYGAVLPVSDEILRLQPENRKIRIVRAVSLLKMGRDSEGTAAARKLMTSIPPVREPDLLLTLAESLYNSADLDGALALCDDTIRNVPEHPIAWLWRARVLLRQKKLDPAMFAAQKSLIYAPQLPFARELLVRIYSLQGRTADAAAQAAWLKAYEDQRAKGPAR